MDIKQFFVCLMVFPYFLMGQMQFPHPGQYGPPVGNEMYQQQLPMHQQQLPIQQQQQQQQQQTQINQQQPPPPQQQPQINQQGQINQQQQQPQMNQQQPQINQQGQMNQQQPQINQQGQMNQQQPQMNQQMPMNPQQGPINDQQYQMNPPQGGMYDQQQQQYYQGNMGNGFPIQSGQGYQVPPLVNQFQQPSNDQPIGQNPSISSGSSENYLVGNLSESFTFSVAPPSTKVTYIGLNGYSLYINNVGFSNKSKFSYDERHNRLTIHSLDPTTVGYYSAVDTNWQTFVNILSAINVSSLQIENSHVSEDNNGSSLVSCSVSIIRSTFKLPQPPSTSFSTNNNNNNNFNRIGSSLSSTSTNSGIEQLPRLDLFISTRTPSSTLPNNKFSNDTINEHIITRKIFSQRPLTRADHNGTIRCQVESNNNMDIFLIQDTPIDIEYGPNLEAGAIPTVTLQGEALRPISMDCQIEANPYPSYVWYDLGNNNLSTNNIMPYYGHQNPYGNQYPLQPQVNIPTAGLSVFGHERQLQRIYQNPGQYSMQCQAQARGKTVKQHFIINVMPSANGLKNLNGDGRQGKSYKIPMIIGLIVGGILLLLLVAIIVAALFFLKRRKAKSIRSRTPSTEKLPTERGGNKSQWNNRGNLNNDNSRYKHDVLRGDTSSTSHLVESTENNSNQPPPLPPPPPIPTRASPIISTHSSYRQAPVSVSVPYTQASSLPGFRHLPSQRSYSPNEDDLDEDDSNLNPVPLPSNRSRTTPFGSRKSLTESLHSLRSNQQSALQLPTKKRSTDAPPPPPPPPVIPKRDEQSVSPKSIQSKNEYQHHHYHNPAHLRAAQQSGRFDQDISSEEDEQIQQQFNNTNEGSPLLQKKFTFRVEPGPSSSSTTTTGRRQGEYRQQQQQQQSSSRRLITPPPPQRIVVHQPPGMSHDEVPPSYHQISNPPVSSNSYVYQEPTEV